MVWLLAFDRLTVKAKAGVAGGVLLVVSSGLTMWSMESAGWVSSFWIVPVPTALAIVALVAPDRLTAMVSSSSNAVSAHPSTVTGLLVSPGANVSVLLLWLMYSHSFPTRRSSDLLPIAVTLPMA